MLIKRIVFSLFFLLLLSSHSISQSYKIGVISDIHYLSQQLMDSGVAVNKYVSSTARDITSIPSILDSVLLEFLDANIDILLIPGDMAKDGEKQSHLDLVEKFRPLINKGIRIFVVPGNHDINVPNSFRYQGDQIIPVDNITPANFETIYFDCGYSTALMRDTASLSYVAEIDEKIWLLAVDACRYKEYEKYSISGGQISVLTESWILNVLEEAKKRDITVISMMHHGLVEHFEYQGAFFADYLVDDWYRLASLFADNGVKAIFTGHFHANDIAEFISVNGNKIYDIETGSLSAYPFPYRYVDLSLSGMDISTKNITSTIENPDFLEKNKTHLKELAVRLAEQKIRNVKPDISSALIAELADLLSEIFLLHVKGDEVLTDTLKNRIGDIAAKLGFPVDTSFESNELDSPPADNKLSISF